MQPQALPNGPACVVDSAGLALAARPLGLCNLDGLLVDWQTGALLGSSQKKNNPPAAIMLEGPRDVIALAYSLSSAFATIGIPLLTPAALNAYLRSQLPIPGRYLLTPVTALLLSSALLHRSGRIY